MKDNVTIIRVSKEARRLLRTIAAFNTQSMLEAHDALLQCKADELKGINPTLWDQLYERAADKEPKAQ